MDEKRKSDSKEAFVKLEVDFSEVEELRKKTEEMTKHIQKAMELAGSIASTDIDFQVNAVVDGRHTEFARVTTDTEYKIQSLHFDAEKWRLEINGEAFEAPVMLVWPDNFTNEAWTRRMIVNPLPKEESIKRAINGDRLPILSISFIDGTGSYSIAKGEKDVQ